MPRQQENHHLGGVKCSNKRGLALGSCRVPTNQLLGLVRFVVLQRMVGSDFGRVALAK